MAAAHALPKAVAGEMTAEQQTAMVKQVLRHLPQRSRQAGRLVVHVVRRREGDRRRSGADCRAHDPADPRRHDAAAGGEASRRHGPDRSGRQPRGADRSHGGAGAQSGLAAVPARQPRRVRARGPRPDRHRRGRQRVPAARYDQQRLRQCRRLAGDVADADGRLSARRQPDQPSGGRRSNRDRDLGHLQDPALEIADGARRRRADWHSRRPLRNARLPG